MQCDPDVAFCVRSVASASGGLAVLGGSQRRGEDLPLRAGIQWRPEESTLMLMDVPVVEADRPGRLRQPSNQAWCITNPEIVLRYCCNPAGRKTSGLGPRVRFDPQCV